MTKAERARLTNEWFTLTGDLWDAYNARPPAEVAANLNKIEAAGRTSGTPAARRMAMALGMPFPPDVLGDPLEVLRTRRAEGEELLRDELTEDDLSHDQIEEIMHVPSGGRVDH